MTKRGCEHFTEEMFSVIQRMRLEYDMTYAEMVGCLHIAAMELTMEALHEDDDYEGEGN